MLSFLYPLLAVWKWISAFVWKCLLSLFHSLSFVSHPSCSLSFSYHCQILYLFWHSPINRNCSWARCPCQLLPHFSARTAACVCVCCVCVRAERTVDRWCRTAGPEWQVCVTRASAVVKERKKTLTKRNYLKRNISASLWLPGAGKQRGGGDEVVVVVGGHLE